MVQSNNDLSEELLQQKPKNGQLNETSDIDDKDGDEYELKQKSIKETTNMFADSRIYKDEAPGIAYQYSFNKD